MRHRTPPAVGLLLAAGLLGCSNTRPAVDMNEVWGRVTVKGKPAANVIMVLTPVKPGEGRQDDCAVADGAYRKQLIAARYKVSFTQPTGGTPVPVKYRSPDTSDLVIDATRPDEVNFDLK
jgi:hypothetical protein